MSASPREPGANVAAGKLVPHHRNLRRREFHGAAQLASVWAYSRCLAHALQQVITAAVSALTLAGRVRGAQEAIAMFEETP